MGDLKDGNLNREEKRMQYAVWHRTLFDPETEIRRLEMWFQDNPNPKYELVVQYTDFLNKQPFRNAPNLKLVPENIRVWFKYQRANSDSEEIVPTVSKGGCRLPTTESKAKAKAKGKGGCQMPQYAAGPYLTLRQKSHV